MFDLKVSETDQEKFLKELKEEKYLDDERFIRSYIHSKIYIKKWGKKKIQAELSIKKLDKKYIQQVFLDIDDEKYIDNLHHLAEKKWSTLYKKEFREKQAAIFRYLASKGYENDLIMDWIKIKKNEPD